MGEKLLKRVNYIDTLSGETYTNETYVDKRFDNQDGYLPSGKRKHFTVFDDYPLPKEIAWADRGRTDSLKYFILNENQMLAYKSNGVIKPLGIEQIAKHLDINERAAYRLIKTLKKYKVLKEIQLNGVSFFMFSPLYAFRGKRISLFVYIAFQDELKDLVPSWAKQKFLEQAKEIKDLRVLS